MSEVWECMVRTYTNKRDSKEAHEQLHSEQEIAATKAAEKAAAKTAAKASDSGGGAGSSKKKKFKWSVGGVDDQYVFPHASAVAAVDLHDITWQKENVDGVERSDKGSEGLFFVGTKQGAIVLKRSKAIGSECFCTLLAMRLGIQSTMMRIVDTNSEEGITMLHLLASMDKVGRVRTTLYDQVHLLILTYLARAKNCNQIEYAQARELFGGEGVEFEESEIGVLRQLGRMLALDVLVNNCDRLPFIWQHRGNPGNIMFTLPSESASGTAEVISIDGQIIGLEVGGDEHANYVQRTRKMLDALKAQGDEKEVPEFRSVRDKFREWFEYDIGEAGCLELQRGFVSVVSDKAVSGDELERDMNEWRSALLAVQPPLTDLPQIRVDFVMSIWKLFEECLT